MCQIRLANLRILAGRYETVLAFAEAIHRDETQLYRYLNDRQAIGDRFARYVETALDLPRGWMDHPHPAATDGGLLATMEAFVANNPPKDIADAVGMLLSALNQHFRK
jgi:hypothetical protein